MVPRAVLLLAALLWLVGWLACGAPQGRVPAVPGAGALYDEFYPDHVEICAVSQIRPLDAPHGGSGGHAAMYLTGVCLQEDASYPLLELCDRGTGAGVSVNKMFRNVNWVAVPDRTFFLHGRVREGEPLTQERFDATLREAIDEGLFRGVEIHDDVLAAKPAAMSREEFIARESIGTDFALRYGRTVFCAKLPVTKSMLAAAVAYLNELNRRYGSGEADYEWSGYHDNCTHTIHNALAHAGVWRPKSINRIRLLQLFNLAVPANEFVNLAEFANEYAIEDLNGILRDPLRRETLRRHGWLPGRHGALIEVIPVHEPNEVYDTTFNVFVLEGPLLQIKTRQGRRMIRDVRYTQLEANLRRFETRYEAMLRARPRASRPREAASADTAERYWTYIERQLEDVKRKLEQLAERRGRAAPPGLEPGS